MERDRHAYRILILEDNEGNYVLLEDFLEEQILAPELIWVTSFEAARQFLAANTLPLDVILLDLSLPDRQGQALIEAMLQICGETPVIVLTGYSDINFGIASLSLGVSDYLLKDELSGSSLYKSLRYSMERQKYNQALLASEKRYSDLFHLSPQPMWVFDVTSLKFLNVNQAAIQHYGYSHEEFLQMQVRDIRPEADRQLFDLVLERTRSQNIGTPGIFRHQKKNGEIIQVELKVKPIRYQGSEAMLVLANDVTPQLQYIKTIETQNAAFKDITWMQSHVVRAPLARLMGLMELLESSEHPAEQNDLIKALKISAQELDSVIHSIVRKAESTQLDEVLPAPVRRRRRA